MPINTCTRADGWSWKEAGSGIELSENRLVARKFSDYSWKVATGGLPMTRGRHYWEVELTATGAGHIFLGVARPAGLHHDKPYEEAPDSYCIFACDGSLYANGRPAAGGSRRRTRSRKFVPGDRVGVLLDLDARSIDFYRNGKRCGRGFEGVTGPLVRTVELETRGDEVTIHPRAVAPTDDEGAECASTSESEGLSTGSESDSDSDGSDTSPTITHRALAPPSLPARQATQPSGLPDRTRHVGTSGLRVSWRPFRPDEYESDGLGLEYSDSD